MEAIASLSWRPRISSHRLFLDHYPLGGKIMVKKFVVHANQSGESESEAIDDKMIVLRMRIKKMKVLEADALHPSPDWKDWEKKLFSHYHEDVCEGVEILQSYLMNTRPSVALGMLALLAMSVPFSSSVVLANVLKVARGLLAGCHVCIDIDF